MPKDYNFASLAKIRKHEPLMRELSVSEVARSPGGFLPAYKKVKGNPKRLSEAWKRKRNAFIARTLPQYRKNPTLRRKLALLAWAYSVK